jgi:hypothetical protein
LQLFERRSLCSVSSSVRSDVLHEHETRLVSCACISLLGAVKLDTHCWLCAMLGRYDQSGTEERELSGSYNKLLRSLLYTVQAHPIKNTTKRSATECWMVRG